MCCFNRLALLGACMLFGLSCMSSARAEEWNLPTSLREIERHASEGSYPSALMELERARNYLLEQKNERVKKFFPGTLRWSAGKSLTGEEIEVSVALGLTNMVRLYKGEESELKVSLLGGGRSISAQEESGLGRMAAMIQKEEGGVGLQIGGCSALLDESGARPELSVFLKSGGILKLEGRKSVTGDQLKGLAAKIDIKGLDTYLQGAQ